MPAAYDLIQSFIEENLSEEFMNKLNQLDSALHEVDDEAFSKWKLAHKFIWHEVSDWSDADVMQFSSIVLWIMCNNTLDYLPLREAIREIGQRGWGV